MMTTKKPGLQTTLRLILLISVATHAQAEKCGLNLELQQPSITWLHGETESLQFIKVSRNNNECNQHFVTFERGSSPNYIRTLLQGQNQQDMISYNLYHDRNSNGVLKDIPDISNEKERITGSFASNEIFVRYRYFATLNSKEFNNRLYPPGSYSDTVLVKLYSGTLDQPTLEDSQYLSINLLVPEELNISLVDTGQPFDTYDTHQDLDFGELQSGEQRDFDLIIVSNAGYSASVSSQNDGKLKHETQSSYIDYQFYVDHRLQSLANSASQPTNVLKQQSNLSLSGRTHSIMLQIGDIRKKLSGRYQDYITITVTTTD